MNPTYLSNRQYFKEIKLSSKIRRLSIALSMQFKKENSNKAWEHRPQEVLRKLRRDDAQLKVSWGFVMSYGTA